MNTKPRRQGPGENKELMHALQELRRGSRTQRHTLKKYKGTRDDARKRAIREW